MSIVDTGSKSTISYTPLVADISAFILAGNGVDALNFAMSQLLDAEVEWALDITNKRVTYSINATGWGSDPYTSIAGQVFSTAEAACSALYPDTGNVNNPIFTNVIIDGNSAQCYYTKYGREPAPGAVMTLQELEGEDEAIPITTISTKILANAQAGNNASQEALTQITINKFANDDFAAELDANATPFP